MNEFNESGESVWEVLTTEELIEYGFLTEADFLEEQEIAEAA